MTLPRPLMLLFIFLAILFAYGPTLAGSPIWDDNHFIFWRFHHDFNGSHVDFWRFHIWPMFDSVSLWLYQLWGNQTLYWHLTCLLLHIANGLLIGKIVRWWRPQWAFAMAVLFWLHPLNMMSVGWIIQLKTVMCAHFALWAIIAGKSWWRQRTRGWYWLSLGLFFLSVASKSSTLPLPWLLLLLLPFATPEQRRQALRLLPFLLLTLVAAWRIHSNSMVQSRVQVAQDIVEQQITTPPSEPAAVMAVTPPTEEPPIPQVTAPPVAQPAPEPVPTSSQQPPPESAPVAEVPAQAPQPPIVPVERGPTPKLLIVTHTLTTYLVRPWWPWPLSPFHGVYRGGWDAAMWAGCALTLLTLAWALIKRQFTPLLLVISQLILYIPVSGIVVAPYMTLTTISEQHFYMAIPFALALQLWWCEKLASAWKRMVPVLVGGAFLVLTANYAQVFRNEEAFYQHVLAVQPRNQMAALNLSAYYAQNGQYRRALGLINSTLKEISQHPVEEEESTHKFLLETQKVYQEQLLLRGY